MADEFRSTFRALFSVPLGLAFSLPAWALEVTAPEGGVIAAGRDYATEVLADPWDLDGPGDIALAELKHLTDPDFTGGVLRATTTGADSNVWMTFQGVPSAFNLTRGSLYPIKTARYTHLSVKMRLSMNDGSELPNPNRQMNAFFFEDENAISDGRFGFTRFLAFPDDQWHIVSVDLRDPDNIHSKSSFLWTDFEQVEGFRVDPSGGLAGVDVEIDWVRLTRVPATDTEVTVSWTGAANPVDIFAVDADGAALLLRQGVGGSSTVVSLAALAPGDYRIEVNDGAERQQSPGLVTVNNPPIVRFRQPDVRGDTAMNYGQAANGNSWASLDSGDIDRVLNVNALSFSNPSGTLYGRPTSNDPSVVFFTPDAIDTGVFRALCYTLEIAGPRNIRDGSVARALWGDSLSNLSTSEDIVVQSGVNEYCIDLREIPLEGGGASDWQGTQQWFRLDPHEFTPSGSCPSSGTAAECRDFRFHGVTLAPFDKANPTFTLEWDALNLGTGAEIDLFLDPDEDAENGNEIIIAQGIVAQSSGSLEFDFSTLNADAGDYWILGVISDGRNVNRRHSGGPLRLGAVVSDVIFIDGFESP